MAKAKRNTKRRARAKALPPILPGALKVDGQDFSVVQDPKRINIHQRHELAYWSNKFGVTPAELKNAVKVVGVSVSAIEKFFGMSPDLPTIDDVKNLLVDERQSINADMKALVGPMQDNIAAILTALNLPPTPALSPEQATMAATEARLRRARLRAG